MLGKSQNIIEMKIDNHNKEDIFLINQSLEGDKKALGNLIKKHQTWIFNVAINLTSETTDASDLMQEVLIKVVTNLGKFEQKSEFRTWVYRIIKNHFLNSKRSKPFNQVISWTEFGNGLDATKDEPVPDQYDIDKKLLVKEAKQSCMKGMLLCLTKEQRLIYVMGELFEMPDSKASEILDISKANFRKKLSRTRKQLYNFMNEKCGLVNKDNPCRCARKTAGFIKAGYVNPQNLQFQKNVISKIEKLVDAKVEAFHDDVMPEYRKLFQDHHYQKPENELQLFETIISMDSVKKTFDLN